MVCEFCNWRRSNHPKLGSPAGVVVFLLVSAAVWAQEPSFHTSANFVLIDVSVTTSKGVPVGGLKPENFEVRENGRPQEILRFDSGSASVAMVVAADFSGSMKPRQMGVASGVGTLAGLLQPDDEAGLLLFNEYILPLDELAPMEWRTALMERVPTGQTAIYDAVHQGLEKLAASSHQRRVLIVLSDGADTASRTKRSELFEALRATGALVYCVGLFKPGEAQTDAGLLRDIAERSGGLAYFQEEAGDLTPVFERIMRDLRSRYVLMFRAEGMTEGEAEVRRISVTARDGEGKKLRIRARREYTIDNQ